MLNKRIALLLLAVVVFTVVATPALAKGRPGVGELLYEGEVVRTVVPPAAFPNQGRDNLYVVPDQRPVIAVAPGDTDYHGGQWAVHTVSWNVASYTLGSEADVLAAAAAGDVTITRVAEADFLCPIQP